MVADFKDEAVHYVGLLVFASLRPKCQYIQVVHSLAKFIHPMAMPDINDKLVGFIGDRNGDQKPYPVLIQGKKAWDLARLDVFANEMAMTTYYGDEANGRKLWKPMSAKVEMLIPRMVVVPLALVSFLLDQSRLSNELYGELAS